MSELPPEWLAMAKSWVIDTMARASLESVPPGQRMYVISMVGRSMRVQGYEPPDGWERALSLLCSWGDPADAAHGMTEAGMAVTAASDVSVASGAHVSRP